MLMSHQCEMFKVQSFLGCDSEQNRRSCSRKQPCVVKTLRAAWHLGFIHPKACTEVKVTANSSLDSNTVAGISPVYCTVYHITWVQLVIS